MKTVRSACRREKELTDLSSATREQGFQAEILSRTRGFFPVRRIVSPKNYPSAIVSFLVPEIFQSLRASCLIECLRAIVVPDASFGVPIVVLGQFFTSRMRQPLQTSFFLRCVLSTGAASHFLNRSKARSRIPQKKGCQVARRIPIFCSHKEHTQSCYRRRVHSLLSVV